MTLSGHSLSKDVNNMKISGNMRKSDDLGIHGFPNRMAVHLNMLRTLMKNKIGHNLNGISVVCMKRSGVELGEAKLS